MVVVGVQHVVHLLLSACHARVWSACSRRRAHLCASISLVARLVVLWGGGWWTRVSQSELQRTSGGHRIKCALRNNNNNRIACYVMLLYNITRHSCCYKTNMVGRCVPAICCCSCSSSSSQRTRISTRPPLTAASQQDTHTHANKHAHIMCACVFVRVACAPVVCPRRAPYCVVPVIGTSEVCSKGSQTHTTTKHARARRKSCVCV